MKKKLLDTDIPPPPCACGKPGTCQVEITVRRLALDREAGAYSTPYWTASFKGTVASVSAIICDDCYRRDVRVTLAVSAAVEKARPT
jgi:hypothetical protein